MTTKKQPARKHKPGWKDHTRKARNARDLKKDNDLANEISSGKYPTLRRLVSAAKRGEILLTVQYPAKA
jgi:hypothetical protein